MRGRNETRGIAKRRDATDETEEKERTSEGGGSKSDRAGRKERKR